MRHLPTSHPHDLSRREAALFSALRLVSRTMAVEWCGDEISLDVDDFDNLTDHLAIVTPVPRFGAYRFEFYGAAFAESSPRGDLTGVSFGDLLDCSYYRGCLSGFSHVGHVGQPHVTRDHPVVGGVNRYFTRLLIPLFSGRSTVRILCAAMLHDSPTRSQLPDRSERPDG